MPPNLLEALIVALATVGVAWWVNRRPRLLVYQSGEAEFFIPTGTGEQEETPQTEDTHAREGETAEAEEAAVQTNEQTQTDTAQDVDGYQLSTYTMTIANQGRGVAEDIEIGYPMEPLGFNIKPPLRYEVLQNPDGSKIVQIPTLGGKQQVTLSHLYIGQVVGPSFVKSKAGRAEVVTVLPQRVFPTWVQVMIVVPMFVGFVYLLAVLFNLAEILWTNLPVVLP